MIGANRHIKDFGDFFIRKIFEIEQGDWLAVNGIDFFEGFDGEMTIHAAAHVGLHRAADIFEYFGLVAIDTGVFTTAAQKFAVKSGEQPDLTLDLSRSESPFSAYMKKACWAKSPASCSFLARL